jgi:hypothetical protein
MPLSTKYYQRVNIQHEAICVQEAVGFDRTRYLHYERHAPVECIPLTLLFLLAYNSYAAIL